MPPAGVDRQLAAGRGVAARDESAARPAPAQAVAFQTQQPDIREGIVELRLRHVARLDAGAAVRGLAGLRGAGVDLSLVAAQTRSTAVALAHAVDVGRGLGCIGCALDRRHHQRDRTVDREAAVEHPERLDDERRSQVVGHRQRLAQEGLRVQRRPLAAGERVSAELLVRGAEQRHVAARRQRIAGAGTEEALARLPALDTRQRHRHGEGVAAALAFQRSVSEHTDHRLGQARVDRERGVLHHLHGGRTFGVQRRQQRQVAHPEVVVQAQRQFVGGGGRALVQQQAVNVLQAQSCIGGSRRDRSRRQFADRADRLARHRAEAQAGDRGTGPGLLHRCSDHGTHQMMNAMLGTASSPWISITFLKNMTIEPSGLRRRWCSTRPGQTSILPVEERRSS